MLVFKQTIYNMDGMQFAQFKNFEITTYRLKLEESIWKINKFIVGLDEEFSLIKYNFCYEIILRL